MIPSSTIPTPLPAQNVQAHLAASAQIRAHAAHARKPLEAETPSAASDTTEWSSRSLAGQTGPPAVQNLTLALSPIEDNAQASVATQLARALIQAQPRAAILAQANAPSQSAQRLLQ